MIGAKKYKTVSELFENSKGGEKMRGYKTYSGANPGQYVARRPYYKRTIEDYQLTKNAITLQREAFEMEKELEASLTALREDIGMYMEGRITLGDLLEDILDSSNLCQRIGVFSR